MIMKERLPPLRWRASSPGHILGHARLSDIDAELEQFSMDPRRAPQRIGNAHLADQPADLQRHNRPATTASRLPAPIRPETRAMPADNGVRLNDRQSIANSREQPIETNQYQSVDGTEGEFLWSSSPQDVYLLPQRPNLCLERCPRPEQIDDRPTNKSAKIPHPTTGLPDSRSTASRIVLRQGQVACDVIRPPCAPFRWPRSRLPPRASPIPRPPVLSLTACRPASSASSSGCPSRLAFHIWRACRIGRP